MRALASLILVVVGGLAGCATRASCPPGMLEPPVREPRFVVVRSDYGSSALALLDADGELIDDDWIDSGTRVSSLVTGLSGDVVVPSTPLGGIAWIDRYAVDVLTIAALDGTIEAQIDSRTTNDGFSPNPHDAIRLPDGRILVSRHNPNLFPEATELAHGNDVVVIEGDRVVDAIDLHADEGDVLARPDLLLPLASGARHVVLVTLTRLTPSFMRAASGAALVLDDALAPSAPTTFGALQNCVSASVDPTDPSRAYVLCAGVAEQSEEERRPHAGIVELTLMDDGTLAITGMAAPGPTDPVPSNGAIAVGDRHVIAAAYGSVISPAAPDRLVDIDVAAGTTTEILRSTREAFVFGDGTLDAVHGVALVPDAETRSIVRVDATTATLIDRVLIEGCVSLPPREIGPL